MRAYRTIFDSRSHMSVLVAVADTGNMSKVAELLGTTQPQVSRAVARLEEVAGSRLFKRRRATGHCVDCGKPADSGGCRCSGCRETISENRHYRRALARLGEAVQPLLREADYEDHELILTVAEVGRLLRTFDDSFNWVKR